MYVILLELKYVFILRYTFSFSSTRQILKSDLDLIEKRAHNLNIRKNIADGGYPLGETKEPTTPDDHVKEKNKPISCLHLQGYPEGPFKGKNTMSIATKWKFTPKESADNEMSILDTDKNIQSVISPSRVRQTQKKRHRTCNILKRFLHKTFKKTFDTIRGIPQGYIHLPS